MNRQEELTVGRRLIGHIDGRTTDLADALFRNKTVNYSCRERAALERYVTDLGERAKVVIVSVTEGDDKPVKYPHMFRASEVMILNKIDLLPHVQFDVERCLDHARRVNPKIRFIQLSATRGDNLAEWTTWLREQATKHQRAGQLV